MDQEIAKLMREELGNSVVYKMHSKNVIALISISLFFRVFIHILY